MHINANKEQKSNILSVVSYDYMKPVLKEIGFKFSKKQFNTAKKKRLNENITLNKYKRYIPECKRKLSEEEKNKIIYYLDYYSKESTNINEKIRYLEYSKKFIYQKYYQTDNNRKITYNTFLKYCPKYYKIPKRKTDVCGICELGNGFKNINISRLNNEEKNKLKKNIEIYEKHKKVVDNQKFHFNKIKINLNNNHCIIILDFKQNFKLSFGGNELSQDYYTKRQVSCLGAAIYYKENNELFCHYISYFSNILSHDSLFSGDVLDEIVYSLNQRFTNIHVFTDCGPHFRSKEFLYRVKDLSKRTNKVISLNFFAEYHGKSVVDGHFGRLSKLFKRIDVKYEINSVEEFRDIFELEANENNWKHVSFRVYRRNNRSIKINKIDMKNIKLYLSYSFIYGNGYYYYMTHYGHYFEMDAEEIEEVDIRETKFTPNRDDNQRIRKYFNKKTENILNKRFS